THYRPCWLNFNSDNYPARGGYNLAGEWDTDKLPEHALPEVNRTQEEFHKKLEKTLKERFALSLSFHDQSIEFV
ncbi:Crl family RNA polymerase assembly factor, partial [Vibrio fluvialis]|uniref:Crl family RNA polymerase assembly factor n=1 Tax=Vibrio fluvialis TaxID=676 RepID=UPI00193AF7F7